MAISINPIFPVISAQGAAPDVVLQPGTVINAQVLKILANGLVRIAIVNLSIEVLSEIPLQAGQILQLAVSQTADGIKLAIVGQGGAARTEKEATVADLASSIVDDIAPVIVAGNKAPNAAVSKNPLTPLQALAVSAAAQTAAARQASLAPLFANLGSVVVSDVLPPQLQQAVAQLLALRPKLDLDLGGSDVKAAFRASGLFLEASLASASTLPSARGPDLKAALIVLRQTLQSLGEAAVPAAVVGPPPVRPTAAAAGLMPTETAIPPSLIPEIDVEEVLLPQGRVPVADEVTKPNGRSHMLSTAPPQPAAGMRAAPPDVILNLQQEALKGFGRPTGAQATLGEEPALDPLRSEATLQRAAAGDNPAAAHTNLPPPPFRGALPSAQAVAEPALAPDAPLATIVRHLADETDAAIARQTLLQVASLPDRADSAAVRTDPPAPRWSFEIPFATAAGTAIAQFEISRDGATSVMEAAKRVWQARFSLDIEPAGPVHALISLSGERTSVRMWAERPGTAAQLRAGMSQLSEALSRAELQPGDIVIRHGAPMQSVSAPAGHFLDRAL
jgi:Flagellar hook-length control protein FliK